jgi:hypothetical protein
MTEYKKGEVYTCADPSCRVEITVSESCTGDECSIRGPLMCCDKPMVKKG